MESTLHPKVEELVRAACGMVARGAKEYLDRNGLDVDAAVLAEAMKRRFKDAWPAAVADAKEALACNMDQVADATFEATMVLVGVEAAKEAAGKGAA